MEVILLERVARLGQMGEVVRVKDGFARNFLLPRGKALRATAENRTRFETMKSDLEARSLYAQRAKRVKSPRSSTARASRVMRQASEAGQLFGSVSPRDIVGLSSQRRNIPSTAIRSRSIRRSRRSAGTPCRSSLHPEIETSITVIVARNNDEAARIERGEDVMQLRRRADARKKQRSIAAEAFFEPEAPHRSRRGAKAPRRLKRRAAGDAS